MNPKFITKTRSIFDLSGRVAIVTGAAGGLGRVITFVLVGFGAKVVLASRKAEKLKQLEEEIQEWGGEAFGFATDITKEEEVDRMVVETMRRYGEIDVLVNNSAVLHRVLAEEVDLKRWEEVMETNVTGAFLCAQRVGRTMIPRNRGKIINISSISPRTLFRIVPARVHWTR